MLLLSSRRGQRHRVSGVRHGWFR